MKGFTTVSLVLALLCITNIASNAASHDPCPDVDYWIAQAATEDNETDRGNAHELAAQAAVFCAGTVRASDPLRVRSYLAAGDEYTAAAAHFLGVHYDFQAFDDYFRAYDAYHLARTANREINLYSEADLTAKINAAYALARRYRDSF